MLLYLRGGWLTAKKRPGLSSRPFLASGPFRESLQRALPDLHRKVSPFARE